MPEDIKERLKRAELLLGEVWLSHTQFPDLTLRQRIARFVICTDDQTLTPAELALARRMLDECKGISNDQLIRHETDEHINRPKDSQ